MNLEGKSAIVTGGGSGIGQAICWDLADKGANVCIIDINEPLDTLNKITANGKEARFYQGDVSDEKKVIPIISDIKEKQGLDILINNAGIAHVGNVLSTTLEDFDKIYQVNVRGVYLFLKYFVEQLDGKEGAILNMASIASKVGIQDRFAYSMSKGAVLTMTLSVAKDFVNKGIRCNCICPGRVHTPFVDDFVKKNYPDNIDEVMNTLSEYQPIGRMGTPEEIAKLATFLVSDEASFITGAAIDIDGGVLGLR